MWKIGILVLLGPPLPPGYPAAWGENGRWKKVGEKSNLLRHYQELPQIKR